ncbi:MAG: hypothetical protein LH632_18870 [Rhodoferax sp.]|nr:hypothetical protein [Rhodoferax sp.]
MKINKTRALGLAAVLATALALSACGGGGNNNVEVATSVPDSAFATSAAFTTFILSLVQGDESSEPLTFSAGFTAPPGDETGEPVAL